MSGRPLAGSAFFCECRETTIHLCEQGLLHEKRWRFTPFMLVLAALCTADPIVVILVPAAVQGAGICGKQPNMTVTAVNTDK